jgi:hypothetical protein
MPLNVPINVLLSFDVDVGVTILPAAGVCDRIDRLSTQK